MTPPPTIEWPLPVLAAGHDSLQTVVDDSALLTESSNADNLHLHHRVRDAARNGVADMLEGACRLYGTTTVSFYLSLVCHANANKKRGQQSKRPEFERFGLYDALKPEQWESPESMMRAQQEARVACGMEPMGFIGVEPTTTQLHVMQDVLSMHVKLFLTRVIGLAAGHSAESLTYMGYCQSTVVAEELSELRVAITKPGFKTENSDDFFETIDAIIDCAYAGEGSHVLLNAANRKRRMK